MATFVLLVGLVVLIMLVSAIRDTNKVKAVLNKTHARTHLPRMVTTLIIAVQFNELIKVVEHVSIVHMVGAALILAVVLATKGATEGELA